ncbi:hypothetical protein [Frankia sp. Cr1]|uniref:hypothetical protein n=1 Tax=Frankia sp. Cr1 TaxID=3073931 RepID=UPI002AD370F9|nr:hypothetical protein [Frankia sp. Cr1]
MPAPLCGPAPGARRPSRSLTVTACTPGRSAPLPETTPGSDVEAPPLLYAVVHLDTSARTPAEVTCWFGTAQAADWWARTASLGDYQVVPCRIAGPPFPTPG